jgi:hypothetical protein
MNAIVKAAPPAGPSQQGLIPQNLDQAMRLAEMMARGKLVPEHLRNPADALMVVELAMRFGMSPFAVAQATSVIQGKLMLEGKLVSAAVHSSGILSGRLAYTFAGEGAARRITVRGVLRGETEARTIDVDIKDAKTTNGMWTKQPDQQLVYFATRAWARRHVPEVMLGVYSPEEFDAAPAKPPFNGTTLEGESEAAPPVNDPPPERAKTTNGGKRRTAREWLDNLVLNLSAAQTMADIDAIVTSDEVVKVAALWAPENNNGDAAKNQRNADNLRDLNALLSEAIARIRTPHDPETGEIDDGFPGDK